MKFSMAAALAFPIALAASLAGCTSGPPETAGQTAGHCPQVREYSTGEEKAITRAMQTLPPDNPLVNAMLDYEELRDEARLCARSARR